MIIEGDDIKLFHNIPATIQTEMLRLEAIDSRDRTDGTPRLQRLRQIPPETGRFIALLAASAPAGNYIEIGTSAGYSTLWLALACRTVCRTITTFEVMAEKVRLAGETFARAGVSDVVTLVHDDARAHLHTLRDIAFCFLDCEKEAYLDCYEAVVPQLLPGGILVADNAINHQVTLQPCIDRARSDERVDSMVVPVGKGELVCRRL